MLHTNKKTYNSKNKINKENWHTVANCSELNDGSTEYMQDKQLNPRVQSNERKKYLRTGLCTHVATFHNKGENVPGLG